MTQRFKRLSHSIYECKYHIVFCPKYRYRILKEEIGESVRQMVYQFCKQKDQVEVLELNIQPDHVHLVVSIAEICGIRIYGIPEREDSVAIVPAVRKSGATIMGASPVGAGLLCEHDWTGRRESSEVCPVARATREAGRSCARQVVRLGLKVIARLPGAICRSRRLWRR